MGKAVPDAVLDQMADYLAANADTLYVCSTEPANFAGIAAVALADVAIDSSDFTKANGDTSGRKTTISAQNGVTVDTSGTAGHIVLADAGSSALLYVTTCSSQALTSGNTVNVPAWKIELLDPS